jgi:NAD(P)-dependent dehydrogenase (short-subunit alcohol dehydrogenase family)
MPVLHSTPPLERFPKGTLTQSSVNVKGLLFTVRKALPLLPDGASIILNASIVGSKGLSANSVYSATKAAVRSFARTWTTDLKQRRIRVNAVGPGIIDTPGLDDLLASLETGEQRRKRLPAVFRSVALGPPTRSPIFAWAERDHFLEIDVNPIVVRERGAGCVVIDTLVVPRRATGA